MLKEILEKITIHPSQLKFIDKLVADYNEINNVKKLTDTDKDRIIQQISKYTKKHKLKSDIDNFGTSADYLDALDNSFPKDFLDSI